MIFPLVKSTGVCPEFCHCSGSLDLGFHIDCSGLGLRFVPQNLPLNTTILNLSNNSVGRLGKYAFTDLPRLSQLDLSANMMYSVDEEAFLGAGSLKILSLRNNLLCFGACEPAPDIPPKPIVFQHLPHLEVLNIWYNSQVTDYASNMCENLSNLKELYLDAPVR